MMIRKHTLSAATLTLAAISSANAFGPEPPLAAPPPDAPPRVALFGTPAITGSYLGIGVAEVTEERARALQLGEERGVEVTRLEDEGPAAKAGLKAGDVVIEYNGQRIEGVEQFMRLVRETPPGREVRLTVSRNGASQNIALRTASKKTWLAGKGEVIEFPRAQFPELRMPDVPRALMTWRSMVLGLEAESLDAQLAQYFGVKEGVLVRSVVKGSAAERAGLRAGDVITRAGDRAVATPSEITVAARAARTRKSLTLTVVRDKQEQSFTLAIEDGGSEPFHPFPRSASSHNRAH